jgi:hypothetical protein
MILDRHIVYQRYPLYVMSVPTCCHFKDKLIIMNESLRIRISSDTFVYDIHNKD